MTSTTDRGQRLLDAALELLRGAPGHSLNIVVLNKALFYLDLAALRDTGETVTGATYMALELGPVVAKYKKRLLQPLAQKGIAHQTEEVGGGKPVILAETAPSESGLNPYVRRKAREIAAYFGSLTSKRASGLSHRNPGWKIAHAQGIGAGTSPKPINLRIAMQELVDRDPWLDEPPDESFDAAILAAESGPTQPW